MVMNVWKIDVVRVDQAAYIDVFLDHGCVA